MSALNDSVLEETSAVGAPAPLIDPYGRTVDYLRVSVTDRCDFRCVYCMADGHAIYTAEIASVCYRNAKIIDLSLIHI